MCIRDRNIKGQGDLLRQISGELVQQEEKQAIKEEIMEQMVASYSVEKSVLLDTKPFKFTIDFTLENEQKLIDIMRSLLLKFDEKYRDSKIEEAYEAMREIIMFRLHFPGTYVACEQEYLQAIKKYRSQFELVKVMYRELMRTLGILNDKKDFQPESSKNGVNISYRKEGDWANVTIKVEAVVPVNIFDFIVFIYEMDLFTEWMPYCTECKPVQDFNHYTKGIYMKMDVPKPLPKREGYLLGFAADRMEKNGTIVFVSKSIDEDTRFQNRLKINIPETPPDTVRYKIVSSIYELEPIDENTTRFRAVTNVDAGLQNIPTFLLRWAYRKFGSMMFEKMLQRIRKLEGTQWEDRKTNTVNKDLYQHFRTQIEKHLAKKKQN
eukprot:TRINITY_DN8845_c0_g2_i1.p1 TRINITY_DN8845_c0_g2~~TRINITY_DN8845_c0_g2_i1.p1  ORF type:complete len:395 (-),score=107.42 TRINITY_DN8845_c0_g2_i1:36-1172(-)